MKKVIKKRKQAYPKIENCTKKIVSKIIVSILIVISLCFGYLTIYNAVSLSKINTQISEYQTKCTILETKIDNLSKVITKESERLESKIENVSIVEKTKKMQLQEKLKQVNVVIINKTASSQGSGVSIKYKDEYYILSAGHMADADTDQLELYENDKKICDLEIVKHAYTPEDTTKNSQDLILLRPHDRDIVPKYYVELNDFNLVTGENILIVGNPLGIEDVISDGRTIAYRGNFIYYIDHTYFGNSGGGIYTLDGKLAGIVSHMIPLQPVLGIPPYMIHGAVSLDTIRKFLENI